MSKILLAEIIIIILSTFSGAFSEEITLQGVRDALGPYSMYAPQLSEKPVVDGAISDPVWSKLPYTDLRTVNAAIPRYPRQHTRVRACIVNHVLYLGFKCRDFRKSPSGARTADFAGFLKGQYTGIVFDLGAGAEKRYLTVLVSPSGALYTASRGADDRQWDVSWNPDGIESGVSIYVEKWTAELAIPLKGLLRDLPGLTPVTVVRSRMNYNKKIRPRAHPDFFVYVHALRPVIPIDERRKNNDLARAIADVNPAPFAKAKIPFFGTLVLQGRNIPGKQLKEIQQASAEVQQASKRTDKPLRGFEFSEKEMWQIYGRPCLFVPCLDKGPVIDGDDSDAAWKEAKGILLRSLLYDVYGPDFNSPTEVKIVSDQRYVYVLAVMREEDVSKIVADPKKALWRHDILEALFDVGRRCDYSAYYHIQANAKGKGGAIRGRSDSRWKPDSLQLSAKIHENRWVVEFKLAFSDIGVNPKNFPKLWGANFGRTRWVNRVSWDNPMFDSWDSIWYANSHGVLHIPSRWGLLYFKAGRSFHPELVAALKKKGASANVPVYHRPIPAKKSEPPNVSRKGEFKRKPTVSVKGEKARIGFEVNEACDVTVSIVNTEGKIIRHLASGLLGANSPNPFRKDSLSQELVWDFKDDLGAKVSAGSYTVRVGLGLGVEYEKTVQWSPCNIQRIAGITCGPEGNLYVLEFYSYSHWLKAGTIRVFNRDGKYLRMLYPYPGNQPQDKVKGAHPVCYKDGSWIPTVYHGMSHSTFPWLDLLQPQSPTVNSRGELVFVNAGGRQLQTSKRLLAIGTDGSVSDHFAGPVITSEDVRGVPVVAYSAADDVYYVTHLRGYNVWAPKHGEHHHVVYRFKWNDPPPHPAELCSEPFIGKLWQKGGGKKMLNDPRDVAVDGKGNIYVADAGNSRVVAFTSDGTYMGEFSMSGVTALEVHPKNGTIYLLTGGMLKKIKGMSGKLVCEFRANGNMLALDHAASRPVLWIAGKNNFQMFVDQGDSLSAKGDPIKARAANDSTPPGLDYNFEFSHNPDNQNVYMNGVIDGNTGRKIKEFPRHVRVMTPGPDGFLYGFGRSGRGGSKKKGWKHYTVSRFTADLKPAKFTATETHEIAVPATPSANQAGPSFTVSSDGRIVVMDIHKLGTVSIFGIDGKVRTSKAVTGLYSQGFHLVRSDSHGAFYFGSDVWEPDELISNEIQGRLPWEFNTFYDSKKHGIYSVPGFAAKPDWHYRHFVGSITKFSAKGGCVKTNEKGDYVLARNHGGYINGSIKGMEWLRNGFSPHMYRETENANCNCEQGGFDVDPHDRVFIPNAFLFHVQVVDRNNNLILRIGKYGNADECSKEDGIGLAWPTCVSAGDTYVYIGDRLLRKMVRLKMVYHSETSAKIIVK